MGKCLFLRKGETHTAPISGTLASELAVGSIVKLMENGTAAEYLVVHQGLPSSMYDASCDGTWLLRKDISQKQKFHTSNSNTYETSSINTYLNETFIATLGDICQSIVKQVKIPYRSGGGYGTDKTGSNGLSCKAFLLSTLEVGYPITTGNFADYIPASDGAKLDYFYLGLDNNSNLRRSVDGYYWWTRSPNISDYTSVNNVDPDGNRTSSGASNRLGFRPALIIPSTALFDKNTLILKGVA